MRKGNENQIKRRKEAEGQKLEQENWTPSVNLGGDLLTAPAASEGSMRAGMCCPETFSTKRMETCILLEES